MVISGGSRTAARAVLASFTVLAGLAVGARMYYLYEHFYPSVLSGLVYAGATASLAYSRASRELAGRIVFGTIALTAVLAAEAQLDRVHQGPWIPVLMAAGLAGLLVVCPAPARTAPVISDPFVIAAALAVAITALSWGITHRWWIFPSGLALAATVAALAGQHSTRVARFTLYLAVLGAAVCAQLWLLLTVLLVPTGLIACGLGLAHLAWLAAIGTRVVIGSRQTRQVAVSSSVVSPTD
ncbi:hypothetical protein [Actinokineospora enzanensis]|uniref:hypothetical protein n=1 Tax=Actinokineospora enzanensis TaxID=155975 RepID=UPI0003A4A940|nr:hypothetical protein [Actinokineospora enzanensis]